MNIDHKMYVTDKPVTQKQLILIVSSSFSLLSLFWLFVSSLTSASSSPPCCTVPVSTPRLWQEKWDLLLVWEVLMPCRGTETEHLFPWTSCVWDKWNILVKNIFCFIESLTWLMSKSVLSILFETHSMTMSGCWNKNHVKTLKKTFQSTNYKKVEKKIGGWDCYLTFAT